MSEIKPPAQVFYGTRLISGDTTPDGKPYFSWTDIYGTQHIVFIVEESLPGINSFVAFLMGKALINLATDLAQLQQDKPRA